MLNNSIVNRDIIIVGQQPWDVEIGSNCKNIALELSKQNRVLYINSPLDRITSITQRKMPKIQKRLQVIAKKEKGLIQLKENLWNLYPDCIIESINWINNLFLFEFINRTNNRKFAKSIKKALKELRFENFILFNDNEILKSFFLKEYLQPETTVYYSRDFILATKYWKKHGERLEPKMIAKSDLCVANSEYLRDYCKQYNKNSFYVGQGCDLDAFIKIDKDLKCKELSAIKKPVIGYVGALLSSRLSLPIIEHIAIQHPEWSIVLVGPEDDSFKQSYLHKLENIYFLGAKDPEELPIYINAFDVCLNPQVVNQLTIGNYPRKIDEYLAMGKPVVATYTPAMETFKEYVYLANSKEEYVELIEKALSDNNCIIQQERVAFAASHSWENNVDLIYKAIIDFKALSS